MLVFLFSLQVHWSLYLPAVNNLPPCGIRQCGQLIWLGSQTYQGSKFTLYWSWNDFPFYIWFWSISRCVTLPLRTHLTTIPILFWLKYRCKWQRHFIKCGEQIQFYAQDVLEIEKSMHRVPQSTPFCSHRNQLSESFKWRKLLLSV